MGGALAAGAAGASELVSTGVVVVCGRSMSTSPAAFGGAGSVGRAVGVSPVAAGALGWVLADAFWELALELVPEPVPAVVLLPDGRRVPPSERPEPVRLWPELDSEPEP